MSSGEIEKFISEISNLPGLGRKSAQRIALYLLKNKERNLKTEISKLKINLSL